MNSGLKVLSLVALAATIVPALAYMAGALSHDMVSWLALLGTVVWYATTPLWMGRELKPDADQVEI